MLITNKAQYTCHKTFIWLSRGEFNMSYLCAGGGGAMIFSFDKSTTGGLKKKASDDQEGLPKSETKKKGNHHSPPSKYIMNATLATFVAFISM